MVLLQIASITVVYFPEFQEVIENIKSYGRYVDCVIVVDNTPTNNSVFESILREFFLDKLIYIKNYENFGIAKALNQGVSLVKERGMSWFLTMDQDSKFMDFEKYLRCCISHSKNNQMIGLFSVNATRDFELQKTNDKECWLDYKKQEITSGNIVRLTAYEDVGGYENKLFIDCVDFEFCLKLRLHKYYIAFFEKIILHHNVGNVEVCTNLLSRRKKNKIIHSPQRIFYKTRNMLYLASRFHKHFPQEYGWVRIINQLFIQQIIKILLYENFKKQKIFAIILGGLHFIKGRFGQYVIDKQ